MIHACKFYVYWNSKTSSVRVFHKFVILIFIKAHCGSPRNFLKITLNFYFPSKKLNRLQVQVHFFYRKPQVPPTVNFRDPARRLLRRPCLAWRTRLIFIVPEIDPSSDLDEFIFIKIKQFWELKMIFELFKVEFYTKTGSFKQR